MARTIIPIATLYSVYPFIFDGFYSKGIDKDDLINHFILSYGDMTPVYQNPSMLKMHIASVSRSLQWSIDHLWEVTQLEYNPIENYDRQETWSENGKSKLDKTNTETTTQTQTASGQSDSTYQKGTVTSTNSGSGSTTHSVAAFNSSSAELASKDDSTNSANGSESYGLDTSGTTESSNGALNGEVKNNGTDTGETSNTHTGRIHGNIGVTTSQQMMQSEIDLVTYNYMDKVCELYAERLLIGVW